MRTPVLRSILAGILSATSLAVMDLRAEWETGITLESLGSDDIVLGELAAYARHTAGDYQSVLTYTHASFWVDYVPAPTQLLGTPNDLQESNDSLRLSLQGPLKEDLVWFVEGGGYLGFSDYQSVWIDEYYHQLFSGSPGYKEGDPMGADALLALRWDYLKTSGFLKASILGGVDRISPNWEPVIGQPLTPSDSKINYLGARIELENVLSKTVRTHNSLTVIEYSDRSPRWALENRTNWAASDDWVLKSTLGGAYEDPDFHALWANLSAEWDYQRTWFLGLNLRLYSDSGEVDGFVQYGLTAPEVDTIGLSATVKWVHENQQAVFGIGPYWSDYHPEDNTSPVLPLFKDRSWLWVQAGWSYQF